MAWLGQTDLTESIPLQPITSNLKVHLGYGCVAVGFIREALRLEYWYQSTKLSLNDAVSRSQVYPIVLDGCSPWKNILPPFDGSCF